MSRRPTLTRVLQTGPGTYRLTLVESTGTHNEARTDWPRTHATLPAARQEARNLLQTYLWADRVRIDGPEGQEELLR